MGLGRAALGLLLTLTVGGCASLMGYDELEFQDDAGVGSGGQSPDAGAWWDGGGGTSPDAALVTGGAGGTAGSVGSGGSAGSPGPGGASGTGAQPATGGAGGTGAASCGDGQCNGGESCGTCAADCGACAPQCGNGSCEVGESWANCSADCGLCPPGNTFYVDPGQSIQAALDAARACAKSLTPTWPNHTLGDSLQARVVLKPGVHTLPSPLRTRGHVRIEATGAEIVGKPGNHLMNVDDNGGGGYNAPDTYWTIDGGVWNANGGGGFSIVHTRKFTMRNMEIKSIGYKAHHLEINSSGGEYAPGVYNVVVENVTMHGVATPHRIDDEAVNIDYSWAGAAHNVAADGTVPNNILIKSCTFYDVPRAVSSHHFQVSGGAPKAKISGVTIQGGSFHDIDPSAAESGGNFENDGAIRPYGWQNVLIEGVTFTRCATAISVYVPSDYPTALGSLGNFVIRNNVLVSCGRAKSSGSTVPLIYVNSSLSGVKLWDVVVQNNSVAGDWVAGTQYFVAVYDTHNCSITGNHFAPTAYSLASEKAHNKYTAQGSTNTGSFVLSGNTVSDGSVDNS